jgi:hypothetical protein
MNIEDQTPLFLNSIKDIDGIEIKFYIVKLSQGNNMYWDFLIYALYDLISKNHSSMAFFDFYTTNNNITAVIALKNDDIIGILSVVSNRTRNSLSHVVIYVLKEYRNSVIAKGLNDNLIVWAKQNRYSSISADIYVTNQASLKYFEKMEYKTTLINVRLDI